MESATNAVKTVETAIALQDRFTKEALAAGAIDLASASNMHLLHAGSARAMLEAHGTDAMKLLGVYPSRADEPNHLTHAVIDMLARRLDITANPDEVGIFGGVYGAYRTILQATDSKAIIIPSLTPENHKRAFRALGVRVIELPMCEHGRPDIELLPGIFEANPDARWLYLTYHRGEVPPRKFFAMLVPVLAKYKARLMLDADTIYTTHRDDVAEPQLPLTMPELSDSMVFLGTLSKEFGAPGLRIGYGIGEQGLMRQIREFQTASLEIIPTPNQFLAAEILKQTDLDAVRQELRGRMSTLVKGLSELGWPIELPAVGVNLFLPVPPAFAATDEVPADQLFVFYLLKQGLLARIGSTDGADTDRVVRLTICQGAEVIERALAQLYRAGVRYEMELPAGLVAEFRRTVQ